MDIANRKRNREEDDGEADAAESLPAKDTNSNKRELDKMQDTEEDGDSQLSRINLTLRTLKDGIPEDNMIDQEHLKLFGDKLVDLIGNGSLFDLLIYGAEKNSVPIPCHKQAISAISAYLKAQFSSPLYADGAPVHLSLIPSHIIKIVLGFAYSSRIIVSGETILGLLEAAEFLDSSFICDAAFCFLHKYMWKLDGDSCLKVTKLIPPHSSLCEHFRARAICLSRQIFDCSDGSFPDLTIHEMIEFMSSDNLDLDCEDKVLEMIRIWADLEDGRESKLTELLIHVRLPLLSSETLKGLFASLPFAAQTLELKKQIEFALQLQCTENLWEHLLKHKKWQPRRNAIAFGCVNAIQGSKTSVIIQFADIDRRQVRQVPTLELPELEDGDHYYYLEQLVSPSGLLYVICSTWKPFRLLFAYCFKADENRWECLLYRFPFGDRIAKAMIINNQVVVATSCPSEIIRIDIRRQLIVSSKRLPNLKGFRSIYSTDAMAALGPDILFFRDGKSCFLKYNTIKHTFLIARMDCIPLCSLNGIAADLLDSGMIHVYRRFVRSAFSVIVDPKSGKVTPSTKDDNSASWPSDLVDYGDFSRFSIEPCPVVVNASIFPVDETEEQLLVRHDPKMKGWINYDNQTFAVPDTWFAYRPIRFPFSCVKTWKVVYE